MFDRIKIERLCNELDRKAMNLHEESKDSPADSHPAKLERLRIRALVLLDVSDTIKQLLKEE